MPNHPNWLWVVYHRGKPLIANTSGYNPLQAHYGDFVVVDNSGPIFLFFFQFWLPKIIFEHGWKLFISPSQTTWVVFQMVILMWMCCNNTHSMKRTTQVVCHKFDQEDENKHTSPISNAKLDTRKSLINVFSLWALTLFLALIQSLKWHKKTCETVKHHCKE
jgi:hypothetical protein